MNSLHGFSGPFGPKWQFWGKNMGRGGAILTPTNSFFILEVVTSVPLLVKIDQEIRLWECRQTDRHTDRHMLWQRQTEFIICPMLYAIAMGHITRAKSLSNCIMLYVSWNLVISCQPEEHFLQQPLLLGYLHSFVYMYHYKRLNSCTRVCSDPCQVHVTLMAHL